MDGISALMDGELDEAEAQRTLAALKSSDELRDRWDEFHLIGDALRREPLLSSRFGEGFSKRLAEEPTVLAPRRIVPRPGRAMTYALSAAASVSAAALVAWVALSGGAPAVDVVQRPAKAVTETLAAQPPLSNLPNDGSMNDYLLVHEGVSPFSSLQGLAPYIRTVSAIRRVDAR